MQQEGFTPNEVTFVSILSACCHLSLVDAGYHHFKLMQEHNGIKPMLEHYNCMIDLLGGAGRLSEAQQLLQTMPFQFNIVGLTCLFNHCRRHGDVNIGRQCFDQAVTMDSKHASWYIMMSNIYSDAGMWEDATKILELRISACALKKLGQAFIEVDNKVHDFVVGDQSHSNSRELYTKLKTLNIQMRKQEYVPHLDVVFQQLLDEDNG